MKRFFPAALLPLLAAAAPPGDIVTEADLRQHIAVLASDAFEGRSPGTEGQTRTIQYISDQWSKAGLVSGATDRPWFQTISLVERTPGASAARFAHGGRTITIEPDGIVLRSWQPHSGIKDAPVLYLGYGTGKKLPDPKGAVVLLLRDAENGAQDLPGYAERRDALLKRGAVAVIGIAGGNTPFDTLAKAYRRRTTALASATRQGMDGIMTLEAASAIIHAAELDITALIEEAAGTDYAGRALDMSADLSAEIFLRAYDSFNVIGKLPGRDPTAGAVLITGHWDHLGLCRPEGEPDRICNGAIDNASGIALMIEAAKKLHNGPRPQRDIYFIATTAEELGLLGAYGFIERPAVPLADVQAVLNIDTVALAPKGTPIAVIGRGTRLDPVIARAARLVGRRIDPDGEADVYLNRQDGWVFTAQNIPAVMLVGAFSDKARLDAYLSSNYHQPDDELTAATELGGAAEDATFHVILARLLADPKAYRR